LLAPIIAPRFSKIVAYAIHGTAARARNSPIHASITARIADASMRGSVRSWRGEKQTTRQRPRSDCAFNSPLSAVANAGVDGTSAPKSLSKANVDGYGGLRSPLARALPGQR
jgi:hypothetical protein